MKLRSLWWILLVVPLIPILWGFGSFLYPRFSDFSDLTISHLPNAVYILHSIRDSGKIPLWSDFLMGGYPFSADPLAGLWYPPNWIAVLLTAPWGFNILSVLHLLWGGLGMAFFLSLSGLKRPAAVFGGIAFAAMPKIFAHLLLGHVSMVNALAWLPWLLAAETIRTNYPTLRKIRPLLPGIILGIIALADVRAAFYAGILYFFFWLWRSVPTSPASRDWIVGLKKMGGFLGQAALGISLAAVILLPLIQFTAYSTRASLSAAGSLAFSLPFKKILNLFIPEFGGYGEWIVYPGAAVIFLIILALSTRNLRKHSAFWLVVTAASLLLSFGSNIPFMKWVGATPVAGLLRVPARWMFIGGFSMIVVASHAFNELLSGNKKPKFDPIFWMVGICAFFAVFIFGMVVMKAEVGINMFWGATGLVLTTIVIALAVRGLVRDNTTAFLFLAILLIDLVGVNWQSLQYRSPNSIGQESNIVIEEIQKDSGIFRVYSPDYAIPQLAAAQARIEMVSAVNPLQLENYSTWMATASGSGSAGYSVAAPPLNDDDLSNSNIDNRIDASKLGLLNVKYIVANYPIQNTDLIEKWSVSNTWIYENLLAMPRAWVEAGGNATFAKIVETQSGKITIEAEGPGNLILSEVDYPGWTVKVDHEKAPIFRIANIIMGVSLDSGKHQVEFVYQPTLQYAGIAMSLVAWLLIGAVVLRRQRQ